MHVQRTEARVAFTLIEVLVVCGIVALLIAIMVPSLARSRENARSVVCRSNLKQWGNAMLMYTQAHAGVLPYENRPKPFDDPDDPCLGAEDENGDKVWDRKCENSQWAYHVRGYICWFDVLDRYFGGGGKSLEDMKICPTVRRFDEQREESYRMNSKLADSTKTKTNGQENEYYIPFRKLDTLAYPMRTVVLFDGDVGKGDPNNPKLAPSFKGRWRGQLSQDGDDVNYRHNRATNLLFAGWNIENVNKKVLEKKSYHNDAIIWQPPDLGPWDPNPNPN